MLNREPIAIWPVRESAPAEPFRDRPVAVPVG